MSLNRSLYLGLTGMNASSQQLNIIGDNIANMNTVGFKSSRGVFQEMLGQSIMGSAGISEMGGGTGLTAVERMFNQGAILGTGVSTDLAISGEGMFALKGDINGANGVFFSRAGQFHRDKEGFIANPAGLTLMGYMADGNGILGSSLSELRVDDTPLPPKATDAIELGVNLDPNQAAKTAPFDPLNPSETSEFSTSVTIYDTLGRAHEVHVFYDKDAAANTWSYSAQIDGAGLDPAVNGLVELSSGPLNFTNGQIDLVPPPVFNLTFTPEGLAPQAVSLDMSKSTNISTNNPAGEGKSAQVSQSQNGSQAGTFQSLDINADGEIIGTFSNGEQRLMGQVALARFRSTNGLSAVGGGLFAESIDSGSVILGAANSGGRGTLVSHALEQSTVDLATEFANMIIAQRGYQANSRSITTADQMMQEAVNLKR